MKPFRSTKDPLLTVEQAATVAYFINKHRVMFRDFRRNMMLSIRQHADAKAAEKAAVEAQRRVVYGRERMLGLLIQAECEFTYSLHGERRLRPFNLARNPQYRKNYNANRAAFEGLEMAPMPSPAAMVQEAQQILALRNAGKGA